MRAVSKIFRNRGIKRLAIGMLDRSRRFLHDGADIAKFAAK